VKFPSLVLVGLAFCSTCFGQNPLTTRTDTQMEIELGRSIYEGLVRSKYLSQNEPYIRRVNRIMAQLVDSLPQKLYPYQVLVVVESEINALCVSGGYILINEGVLTLMPDDNLVAAILAHEIGHGARRHWAKATSSLQRDVLLQTVVSLMGNTPIDEEGVVLRGLTFSRDQEAEADAFGAELYIRAGFDPDKASEAMKMIRDTTLADRTPLYLRRHPFPKDRVANIERRVQELIKGGLKPLTVKDGPELSIESVFGKIPTLATTQCPWQPLAPGMQWEYEVLSSGSKSTYTIKAVGLSTVNGSSIARMTMDIGTRQVTYQLIVDGDRIWRRNRAEDMKSPWATEIIFPDLKGSADAGKWIYQNAGIEDVEIPTGKYPGCIKVISTEEGGRVLQQWFAPGIGLVKRFNEKAGITEYLIRYTGG
jgi:Peptidase family M48